ncbi:Rv1733c family protein [Streptomyces lutosisoli]|uniref:Membrane protein SCJ1.26 n=1 Tax=Streptomyces lutosisoli TaxID=2665721 RepID=A0ABW2VVT0_9ACTN
MRGTKRVRQLLWRWRSNPLRRHDDVVEAWIMLAVWAVIAIGGTLAGVLTAHAADGSFARLRSERHPVQAVLVGSTAQTAAVGADTPYNHVRATVRWTAKDGSKHTGRALVDTGHQTGSKVVVWLNSKEQLTTAPTSASSATVEAAVLGAGAALAFGGLAFAAGRVAQWRLDQRRYDQWGREWDRVGPRWRRKTT